MEIDMATIVGVFNDRVDDGRALAGLVGLGLDADSLTVIWRERSVSRAREVKETEYVDHFEGPSAEARKGAIGGALGGTAGMGSAILAAAGGLAFPEVSGLAVGGAAALAVVAAGALGGSVTGSLIGALLGATDHDATKVTRTHLDYVEALERHGFVVTVDLTGDDAEEAVRSALAAVGAVDITVLDETGRHRIEPTADEL